MSMAVRPAPCPAGGRCSDRRPPAVLALLAGGAVALADSPPSFQQDVAPILFRHCAECHHPGGAGPFPLLTFADARKHARDLADTAADGRMPPWLPQAAEARLVGERRLTDAEVRVLRAWVEAGLPEGTANPAPVPPVFADGWQMGPPDLVIEFPETYRLGADGPDVYRNFVVPFASGTNRFVRAYEFRPGSPAVHHARLLFDATGRSRRLDAADPEFGFPGAMPPAKYPAGHLLGWAPGRRAVPMPEGMSWALDGRGDLVVQLHLQRTGRPENVRPSLALYFTNRPPSEAAVVLGLYAETFEIPAGATNHVVTRSIDLPAAADLIGIMPHAHYLAREVELTATSPGSPPRTLFRIPRWKFDWQDVYRCTQPVSLAAGTHLQLEVHFDNSEANPRNPNHPPRPVRHGPESTDEMAEIWLQLRPRDREGAVRLQRAIREYGLRETVAAFTERVARQPDNPGYRVELAKGLGGLGRKREAFELLAGTIERHPDHAEAHHYIGVIYLERQLLPAAREAFATAVRLDPTLGRAHVGLGQVAAASGEWDEASREFSRALELDPTDEAARTQLQRVRAARDTP